jgi:hypothetical protein
VRTFVAIASRVGPSLLLGLKRWSAAVSQPYCCIHWKCLLTVAWSYDENSVAGWPLGKLA